MTRTRTVLLTGGSRGIGHATARYFADRDWRVLTLSSQAFPADACPWLDGRVQHLAIDLADRNALSGRMDEIKGLLPDGRLDALVNNAGLSPKRGKGQRMGVMSSPPELWRRVFEVNFFSAIDLVCALAPSLCRARGAVVNVASIAGKEVHPFAGSPYATSKAALMALTRELAHELGPRGVRVNSISPGEIDTSILSPGTDEIVRRCIPMKRLGRPEEVAAVIHFLCSEAGSYLNGVDIPIDGGQHV